jgi:hypothetical protein
MTNDQLMKLMVAVIAAGLLADGMEADAAIAFAKTLVHRL